LVAIHRNRLPIDTQEKKSGSLAAQISPDFGVIGKLRKEIALNQHFGLGGALRVEVTAGRADC
jgi:hypothetical protein